MIENSAAHVLELGLILALAAAAGWAARALTLPAVVGYLGVGLIVSPFTPGYVADRDQLQVLADVGVVLLLFEVGVEIDPLRLRREHGRILLAGPVQVLVTTGLGLAAGSVGGLGIRGASLLGLAVALSSSVVVVNITRSRRRTTNLATERALLVWSVGQDITGVALAAGLLATFEVNSRSAPVTAGLVVAFIALLVATAQVVPLLLRGLQQHDDLFLLLSVAAGLCLAGVGARIFGIPLALAAFAAGLAVGESPAADAARAQLLPFRDLFAVLFFVSIGTLIDPAALPGTLGWLAAILGLVVVGKVALVYLMARVIRTVGVRVWQLSVGLGQVGEFSFVLASVGLAGHVIPASLYTAILAAVVVTIAGSSVAVRLGAAPDSAAVGAELLQASNQDGHKEPRARRGEHPG